MVLSWQRTVAVAAVADESPDRPKVYAIVAVAAMRVAVASYDGRSCFPSQDWLARHAGVKRSTVRAVDRWLVRHGYMVQVRPATRSNSAEFRLALPEDDTEAVPHGATGNGRSGVCDTKSTHDRAADDGPRGDHDPADDGPHSGPHGGPLGDHYLGPSDLDSSRASISRGQTGPPATAAAAAGDDQVRDEALGLKTDLRERVPQGGDDQVRDEALGHLDRHVAYRESTGYTITSVAAYIRSQLAAVIDALVAGEDLEDRWPAGVDDGPQPVDGTDAGDWFVPAAYAPPPPRPVGWDVTDADDGAPVARPRWSARD